MSQRAMGVPLGALRMPGSRRWARAVTGVPSDPELFHAAAQLGGGGSWVAAADDRTVAGTPLLHQLQAFAAPGRKAHFTGRSRSGAGVAFSEEGQHRPVPDQEVQAGEAPG